MKKVLCSILRFIKSYFLQALLSVVAFISFENADNLGSKTYRDIGTYRKYNDIDSVRSGTDVAVSAGYDGGAFAMGLICSVCVIMIVWIEINKKYKPQLFLNPNGTTISVKFYFVEEGDVYCYSDTLLSSRTYNNGSWNIDYYENYELEQSYGLFDPLQAEANKASFFVSAFENQAGGLFKLIITSVD